MITYYAIIKKLKANIIALYPSLKGDKRVLSNITLEEIAQRSQALDKIPVITLQDNPNSIKWIKKEVENWEFRCELEGFGNIFIFKKEQDINDIFDLNLNKVEKWYWILIDNQDIELASNSGCFSSLDKAKENAEEWMANLYISLGKALKKIKKKN